MYSIKGIADLNRLSEYIAGLVGEESSGCLFPSRCALEEAHLPSACFTLPMTQQRRLAGVVSDFEWQLRRKGFVPVQKLNPKDGEVVGVYRWADPVDHRAVQKAITLAELDEAAQADYESQITQAVNAIIISFDNARREASFQASAY